MSFSAVVGNGGWVRWEAGSDRDRVYGLVRFEDHAGRLEPVELHMPMVPSQRQLGRLPLTGVTAWVNGDGAAEVRARLNIPGPMLTTAASYFATTFGSRAKRTWVTDMLASQVAGSNVPAVDLATLPAHRTVAAEVDPVLDMPATTPYPPDFWQQFADVYQSLSYVYANPAARIAEANGVPATTVHSWVRRARERGALPPAEHGKRG